MDRRSRRFKLVVVAVVADVAADVVAVATRPADSGPALLRHVLYSIR